MSDFKDWTADRHVETACMHLEFAENLTPGDVADHYLKLAEVHALVANAKRAKGDER